MISLLNNRGLQNIYKLRKVKVFEPKDWLELSDFWEKPTIMLYELFKQKSLSIGDKITVDLRVIVKRAK